jgi:preprotein translocase subunit SecG|tara:strand:+ start:2526 stop:2828 length:303 start_codon:yes stop_codon:yes gene_type:complete
MENFLLVINLVLALILVLLILFQKSEGGALGIGVSQDNFMFSRSAGNFMTKATAVVATLFIICSLALTIISRGELTPSSSVLDKIEENSNDTPSIPENNN